MTKKHPRVHRKVQIQTSKDVPGDVDAERADDEAMGRGKKTRGRTRQRGATRANDGVDRLSEPLRQLMLNAAARNGVDPSRVLRLGPDGRTTCLGTGEVLDMPSPEEFAEMMKRRDENAGSKPPVGKTVTKETGTHSATLFFSKREVHGLSSPMMKEEDFCEPEKPNKNNPIIIHREKMTVYGKYRDYGEWCNSQMVLATGEYEETEYKRGILVNVVGGVKNIENCLWLAFEGDATYGCPIQFAGMFEHLCETTLKKDETARLMFEDGIYDKLYDEALTGPGFTALLDTYRSFPFEEAIGTCPIPLKEARRIIPQLGPWVDLYEHWSEFILTLPVKLKLARSRIEKHAKKHGLGTDTPWSDVPLSEDALAFKRTLHEVYEKFTTIIPSL